MDKKVTEDFFILALNPNNGYFRVSGAYLTYGILGSIFMDLALADAIELSGKDVIVKGNMYSGDPAFDKILETMRSSSRVRSLRTWLKRFSGRAYNFRKELQKTLVTNGILRQERKRFLLIPYSLYYPVDPNRTSKLTKKLSDIILNNKSANEQELMILGLIFACRMHRNLADTVDERRRIRKALIKYIKENPYAEGVSKTIKEMQAAITASIGAAVIASSVSSTTSS